jgi:hypothetical protein
MPMVRSTTRHAALPALILACAIAMPAAAEPFTFRGQLDDGAAKAQGRYALKLTLYGFEGSTLPLAGPLELLDVSVSDGAFAVGVDFGPLPPHLTDGWLEVAVKSGDDGGDYVTLDGRSAVALKATGVCPSSWALGGNALTNPAADFLGTTDAQPLVLRANNQVIGRFQWPPQSVSTGELAPNVILGDPNNSVDAGRIGATIGGGGGVDDLSGPFPNRVSGDFGTIAGGLGDRADAFATVGGGFGNEALGRSATIAGGSGNQALGASSSIPGGRNVIAGGDYSFAAGKRARVRSRVGAGALATNEPASCGNVFGSETCGDEGTFLWADSQNGDFISQGPDQFLVRAQGGVGIQGGNGAASELANVPKGLLHVFAGSAGAGSTSLDAVAVFESAGPTHLHLLAPSTSESGIFFGDELSPARAAIRFDSVDQRLTLVTNSSERLKIDIGGDIGIGTGTTAIDNKLHVRQGEPGVALGNHVVLLENADTSATNSVLALRVSNTAPTAGNNFVTFFDGDATPTALGRIESNATGTGVLFSTGGADYAEWLPRVDTDEAIEPGDLVGLHAGGEVSKRVDGALQVLVASTGAAIAGNASGESPQETHTLIAFVGQVQARVCGPVHAGDAILASDDGSGCGIARAPQQLTAQDLARIAGTAWESNDAAGEHRVRVAVGLGAAAATDAKFAVIKAENAALQSRLATLESDRAQDRADIAALRALIVPAVAAQEQ